MKCPQCGSEISENENFCGNCGIKVNLNQVQPIVNRTESNQVQLSNPFLPPQRPNSDVINEADLITAYIGLKAPQFKKTGFSIHAFLFGFFYAFYRKMWFLGIGWLLVVMISNIFLRSIAFPIQLVVSIVVAIRFKKIYLKQVTEKVAQIKAKNPGVTAKQLMLICSQKGGTSTGCLVLGIICTTVLIIIISGISFTNQEEIESKSKNSKLSQTTSIGQLNLEVPVGFVSSYLSDTYQSYVLNETGDYCNLRLNQETYQLGKGAQNYLLNLNNFDDRSIIKTDINGHPWYHITIDKLTGNQSVYVGEDDQHIYIIEFEIYRDSGKCSKALASLVKSLKISLDSNS